MMDQELDLGDLDGFTVGTEGPVGRRVFLMQCHHDDSLLTLKAEKQQVAVLAEYLARLLSDLESPAELPVAPELEEPTDPHWAIGTLGVTYDEGIDRIVLVAEELVSEEEVGSVARFTITPWASFGLCDSCDRPGGSRQAAVPVLRRAHRPVGTPMPQDERSPATRHLRILARGEVQVEGRLPWSSNRTFLATCCHSSEELAAVYKPGMGERRLWDFPEGVYRREVAAYALSEMLNWGIVPETVEREDGPLGPGSLQRFVPSDFSQHHFTLVEDAAHHERLRTICAFDVVANNTDRKSGHCILGEDGTIWAIDNGLCFHREPKLRHGDLGVRRRASPRAALPVAGPTAPVAPGSPPRASLRR